MPSDHGESLRPRPASNPAGGLLAVGRSNSLLAAAPGFIRRYSFPDGPIITLVALWRTVADAKAFADSPEHSAVVRDLYQQRWQYSHFSALWEMASNHGRVIFCDQCDGITAASESVCRGCGVDLVDVYREGFPDNV